jgi:cytochrome c oxidase subunit 4
VLPVPAAWAAPLGLLVAGAKAALITVVFVEIAERTALVRVAAAAGFMWLLLLFALTLRDYLSRGL